MSRFPLRRFPLLLLFLSLQAFAYLPPAGFVIGHSVTERAGLKALEWTAKITDLKTRTVFKETLKLDFVSGKLSASYQTPSDEPLGSIQGPISLVNKLGKFWLCVALDPNIARVKTALESLRVLPADVEETRLERIGTRVAWVWGVDSVIGFEKDEFTPLLYRETPDARSDMVLFQGFAIASANSRVPKTVTIRTHGEDQFVFELRSIKTDGAPAKEKGQAQAPQLPAVKEWISLVR